VLAWTSLLAGIHIATGVVWLVFFAWLVARVRGAVGRPRVRRALDRVTGCVLVAFGLRVATTGAR
jgi:threonine/homoserine/homoserine lactone efflux protein